MIRIQMDQQTLEVAKDATVLQAARDNGIHIPTLCFHPALKPSGSCKLCAVEVLSPSGRPMNMLACLLKVKAGMVVRTTSEKVMQARTKAFKRLIHMAPQSQRLRNMAAKEGIVLSPAPDGCIQCRLCIRVCKEIVGQNALRMEKHNERQMVVPIAGRCIGCGTCANLCPTQVIQVIDRGNLRTLQLRDMIIGQHPLERCEGCGKYYATEKQIHLVEQRTAPHPPVKIRHHYCPTCAKLFSDRLQIISKQPPKQRLGEK